MRAPVVPVQVGVVQAVAVTRDVVEVAAVEEVVVAAVVTDHSTSAELVRLSIKFQKRFAHAQ